MRKRIEAVLALALGLSLWTRIGAAGAERSDVRMMGFACSMVVLASLWIPSSTFSSTHDPPGDTNVQADTSAEEIVAKYLEAIGGADAVKAVVSKRIGYWVHMFGRDAYLMERSWSRPNSMRTGRPGATTYTVTEGDRSWRVSPEGRRELPAVVARSMSKVADIDGPLVDPREKGVTLAYSGVVRYDIATCAQGRQTAEATVVRRIG